MSRPARPRIAYVINSFEGGGAASPVPAVGRVLKDAGADVRVFALTARNALAEPAIAAAGLDPLVRDGGERDHRAAARWLARHVTDWGATHLWTSLSRATLLGLLLGPRLGLPVIAWQHNAFLKPWNRRLLRLLQGRATLWVADSQSVAELTAERLKVGPERLVTWPIYAADPGAGQTIPWRPDQPLRLGSLGRLHPAKGYDILFAALARLHRDGFTPPVPVELRIAGTGADQAALQAHAAEAGLDYVRFTGFTAEPAAFLADLHLYLQPSRREGFCIAAHEAMTAGLPVIASAVGELAHSVMPGVNGWLVAPGDEESLAAALRDALGRPERLAVMGTAARAIVLDRFSQTRFAETGQEIWARGRAATGW